MGKARNVVAALLRRVFKPREKVTPSDWAEKHIRLSAKTSNKAGRYSLRHTPYLKQIYDDIANPRIRKIILKKSAQVGATQFANNLILFYVANLAFPVLMIMPSKEAAQQFCERSLTPSLHQCDAIKPFLTGNEDDLKKTEYLFSSCIVRVIGAGSPSKLASNPACLCIIDEADKLEDFSGVGEAPALELAEDRTITFPNDKKIVVLSTPTTETTSVVHSQYLLGSQSKYAVKCPHCLGEQFLRFDQIMWDKEACKTEDGSYDLDRVERETFYECEHCKARLTETDKLYMVRAGVWKDTNPKPFPVSIRSYHISALYSLSVTWGGLAKQFLLCGSDPGKLRNFYNSYLGEVFEQRAATIRKDDIDACIKASPSYLRGELIKKPTALIMAVDTQGANFYFAIEAVFHDSTSAVIEWGEAATFQDVYEISQRRFVVKETGEEVGIYKGLIDAGYKTTQVYDFCVKTGFRIVPTIGRQERQGLLAPLRESNVMHKGYSIPLLIINDRLFKDLLYISTIKERAHLLYFPQDTDDELKIQATSERLATKRDKRGKLVTEWVCTNRRNHIGDALKYIEGYKSFLAPKLRAEAAKQKTETNAVEEPPKRQYVLQGAGGLSWD